jgi:hypothetical protein
MSEFIFLYRGGQRPSGSPQEMQQVMQKWGAWMKELENKGHLIDRGHPLEATGKSVKGSKKVVTDGPYAEKDLVGGYTLVKAKDLGEAVELTSGCPILEIDGIVEVRAVMAM